MTDYTKARIWAISGIGYGKGDTIEQAVENHDSTQARNYGSMLSVPVTDVPLLVWQSPEGTEGFVLESKGPRWEIDGRYVWAEVEQIIAARKQDAYWVKMMADDGHEYETL